ncbi:MAG: hypothetical protein Q8920_08660, partial [Bacillota bacterium]|nr:hypothetical protein [Bacillota bacterium]
MKMFLKRICKRTAVVKLLMVVLTVLTLQALYLPVNAIENEINISEGWGHLGWVYPITTSGTVDLRLFALDANNYTLDISGSDTKVYIAGGGKTYKNLFISIQGGASVTLIDVSIDDTSTIYDPPLSPIVVNDNNPNNKLLLRGNNTLTAVAARPGVCVPLNTSLTIDKADPVLLDNECILNSNGGDGGAGIGGMKNRDCGSITIKGGTVNAFGNGGGAGIGGGYYSYGADVTISGGIVNATGGGGGAGIGAGCQANWAKVTISGGTVNATGGGGGAGIGGAAGTNDYGLGGEVIITGGIVQATGSTDSLTGGAGIGGGAHWNSTGNGGTVTISGGKVTAIGKQRAAGIGGGSSSKGGNVTISGGIVYAVGNQSGAGIGGGGGVPENVQPAGKGGVVTITGGAVEAKSDSGYDIGGGKGVDVSKGYYNPNEKGVEKNAEGSNNYFSGGSIKVFNVNCAPVVSSTDNRLVDRYIFTIPNINSVTSVSYTVDGGAAQNVSTDGSGELYLWLPRETGLKAYNISVTVLDDPSKTYTFKTDPIVTIWGKPETYAVTGSHTIDLTAFSSAPDAGNLTIAASGNTADVKIVGDTNVTYKNLHIYIEKGAHVTLYNVNIDNGSCSVEYSPVEAGDNNSGNTLYTMELNNVTGSKNMPGVFVAEGTNLNIFRSSDPMAGTTRLFANGGSDAAGIGGKNGGSAGTISFNNGSVTAKGNGGGSGIGGGNNGTGGTVSVTNAIVTAQKGSSATYDIGGGQGAAGGKSYITSGVVFASSISNTPEVSKEDSTPLGKKSLKLGDTSINVGIKIDNSYYCSNKTDSNGYLNLYFTKGTHSVWHSDSSKLFIISDSSSDYLTVTKSDGISYTCYSPDNSGNININESGTYLISGNATIFKSSIKIGPNVNANITLDNVKLSAGNSALSLDSNTTANLTIKGTNALTGGDASPGINVPKTSVLSIIGTDSDSLTIDGNGSAGIYNDGSVSISGGKITANGGTGGAGIGGSGNFIVTGGTVNAVKGNGATYDIGGGSGLEGGTCYFSGGSINAADISCTPVISNTDSTPVYLTTVHVIDSNGLALKDTTVSCTMPNGVKFDAVTDSEGKLYLWLPVGNNTIVTLASREKSYKATGNITNSGPNIMTTAATVDSVTVTPATVEVQKGKTQTFSAEVTGTNNPGQTVVWSVSGNKSTETTINSSGVLTIAGDETASKLIVTATSDIDNLKSGTAAVTVTDVPTPEPTVDSVTVSPATATVQKGKTQTFSAEVTGTNNPAQTVIWNVSGGITGTSIDENGVLTVADKETAVALTVTATSTVDNKKTGTATVNVTDIPAPEPTVDSVTITPATATVQKGKTQTFSAAVTGTNNPAQTVTWSVSGGVTGTGIDNNGVLTVAADETAVTLTVTATSTADNTKSGTAIIKVSEGNATPPNNNGGGGSTTVTPPAETPKTEITIQKDTEVVTATTTVEATSGFAGNASASVTESQIADAVNKSIETAVKEGEGTTARVEVRINAPADSKSVEASLPKAALDTVAESRATAMTISTPVADITFDDKSLDTISGQATGDVKITAAKADVSTLSDEAKQA